MEARTAAAKIQPWRKLVTRGLCGSLNKRRTQLSTLRAELPGYSERC